MHHVISAIHFMEYLTYYLFAYLALILFVLDPVVVAIYFVGCIIWIGGVFYLVKDEESPSFGGMFFMTVVTYVMLMELFFFPLTAYGFMLLMWLLNNYLYKRLHWAVMT